MYLHHHALKTEYHHCRLKAPYPSFHRTPLSPPQVNIISNFELSFLLKTFCHIDPEAPMLVMVHFRPLCYSCKWSHCVCIHVS